MPSDRREMIWRVLRTFLCVAAIYGVVKFAATAGSGVGMTLDNLSPTILEVGVVVVVTLAWVAWRSALARREDRIWREWH